MQTYRDFQTLYISCEIVFCCKASNYLQSKKKIKLNFRLFSGNTSPELFLFIKIVIIKKKYKIALRVLNMSCVCNHLQIELLLTTSPCKKLFM